MYVVIQTKNGKRWKKSVSSKKNISPRMDSGRHIHFDDTTYEHEYDNEFADYSETRHKKPSGRSHTIDIQDKVDRAVAGLVQDPLYVREIDYYANLAATEFLDIRGKPHRGFDFDYDFDYEDLIVENVEDHKIKGKKYTRRNFSNFGSDEKIIKDFGNIIRKNLRELWNNNEVYESDLKYQYEQIFLDYKNLQPKLYNQIREHIKNYVMYKLKEKTLDILYEYDHEDPYITRIVDMLGNHRYGYEPV